MPHTKLKVCSVLLIIYGAGDVLSVLVMLMAALLGGSLGISDMLSPFFNASGTVVTLIFLLSALIYAGLAVGDLMAGINGLRFCGGSGDIKFCRIPAIVVIVIQAINVVLRIFSGDIGNAVAPVIHIVIAVLCIVFAGQVEQYNLTRPPVEDLPFFNLKDDY